MSALQDLLKAVHDESFSEDMFNLGEAAAAELAALRERVKQLEESETILSTERDELYQQLADANELLWEFTEYPQNQVGERAQSRIEDYFKKYNPE